MHLCKWKEADPLLKSKVDSIIEAIKKGLLTSLFRLLLSIHKITENNKAVEAKAWVKKYFNEALVDFITISYKLQNLLKK